jgi:hypothetical protein
MECLIQYLDDIEDFIFAIALLMERVRRAARTIAVVAASITMQGLGVLLALSQPPLALALASLLGVGMLYSAVTSSPQPRHA